MADTSFSVSLNTERGYTQHVAFDDASIPGFTLDEPPPLGDNHGPNPSRVLGAAVGGCLGASLMFCLRKARIDVEGLSTRVAGTLARNERGRLRIASLHVVLEVRVPAEQRELVERCMPAFEDYCTVTASIKPAIAVNVRVEVASPAVQTAELHDSPLPA